MKPSVEERVFVLVPYDPAEGICLKEAAQRAGKSQTTVRNWCEAHGIGRRVVGGDWRVSQVALAMLLEDDWSALRLYHSGDRASAVIKSYFDRFGLKLPKPTSVARTSQNSQTSQHPQH